MKYNEFIQRATIEMAKSLIIVHHENGDDMKTDATKEMVGSEAVEYAMELAVKLEERFEGMDLTIYDDDL